MTESKQKKYLLILPMSTLNSLQDTEYFTPSKDKKIKTTGYQQEPVPRYLKEKGMLDKVLMINTNATKTQPKATSVTTSKNDIWKPVNELLEKAKIVKDKDGNPQKEIIPYEYFCKILDDDLHVSHDQYELKQQDFATQNDVDKIIDKIHKFVKENKKYDVEILMDLHGGLRVNSDIMTVIFSLMNLENFTLDDGSVRNVAIKPENIYSVKYKNGSPFSDENQIHGAGEAYELLNLVPGVHEFVNYGRTSSLRKYREKHQDISNVVGAMEEIDNGLAMGHIATFEKGLNDLRNSLIELNTSDTTQILKELVKQEYKEIIGDIDDKTEVIAQREDGTLAYDIEKLILWSARKEFYQLAMTLIESEMMDHAQEENINLFDFSRMLLTERKDVEKKKEDKDLAERNLNCKKIEKEAKAEDCRLLQMREDCTEEKKEVAIRQQICAEEDYNKALSNYQDAEDDYIQTKFRKIEGKINRFLIHFKESEINGKKIFYSITDDVDELYFMYADKNQVPETLSKFLNEHRKIKNTRNNANHVGNNTKNTYMKVGELHKGIEDYIDEFRKLKGKHYTMYGLTCIKQHNEELKDTILKGFEGGEDTLFGIRSKLMTEKIFKTFLYKKPKNSKTTFKKAILNWDKIKKGDDGKKNIARVKEFFENAKVELGQNNNMGLFYFVPALDSENYSAEERNFAYFIYCNNKKRVRALNDFVRSYQAITEFKRKNPNKEIYEDESIKSELEKYVNAFDQFYGNSMKFEILCVDQQWTYDDYQLEQKDEKIDLDENTFNKIKEIIFNITVPKKRIWKNERFDLSELVKNEKNPLLQDTEVRLFADGVHTLSIDNLKFAVFNPSTEEEVNAFKKSYDDFKFRYFILCCKEDEGLDTLISELREFNDTDSVNCESKYKVYTMTVGKSQTYNKFVNAYGKTLIGKETFNKLKEKLKTRLTTYDNSDSEQKTRTETYDEDAVEEAKKRLLEKMATRN